MTDTDLGALTAALAKAQPQFATVKRDKEVKVQTKSGSSYSFKYAPLDSILEAVRKPLADNGLVVVQTLDAGDLVTALLHESGAQVSGRMPLPAANDIKDLGSAITYMRRYALQALLGIAAEDDDDGSRSNGDSIQPVAASGETTDLIGIDKVSGVVAKGGSDRYKAEWREAPDGSHVIGFALKRNGEKDMPQVGIMGPIAEALYALGEDVVGQHLTVRGSFYAVRQSGRTTYTRVIVGQRPDDYVETADWRIPALASDPAPDEEAPGPDAPAPGQEQAFDLSDEALAPVG